MSNLIKRRQFLKSSATLGLFAFIPSSILRASSLAIPDVLIIGDSISMGYTPFLQKILEGKATVSHPTENCGPTERGVANLDKWLDGKKYALIYFNFGLHDLKHVNAVTKAASNKASDPVLADIPTYTANLEVIVKKLKLASKRVIFATTTPVPAKSGSPLREPDMPEKYNTAAKEVMKKNKIPVDDLYNFALPQLATIQRPNNVHYTPEGYEILAKRVAETILKDL